MKTTNLFRSGLVLTLAGVFFFSSCLEDSFQDIAEKAIGFDYKTTKEVKLSVQTLSNTDKPLKGVYMEVYSRNPLNADGLMIENSEDFLLYKGISNGYGYMNCSLAPATTVDTLNVLVKYIGLPALHQVALESSDLTLKVGGSVAQSVSNKPSKVTGFPDPSLVSGFYVLGTWNSMGVPNYLWAQNDVISNDLLEDINASLPEGTPLPVSHPEYLNSRDDGSVVIVEDCNVWITFVHEGAGFTNTLAYYYYRTGEAPASVAAISNRTAAFPNVSFVNSSGGLRSGNKVQLLYLDPVSNKYSDVFPAGTTIAWILRANGWSNNSRTIVNGSATYYSDARFNPEPTVELRKHNVLLKDTERNLLLMGFEDLNRTGGDNDFNDAMFYVTANPITAIKIDDYRPIDTPTDTDGDGVGDTLDEYPTDPEKAFNNYYPGKNQTATLAYEDLWPEKGDYDFNDLIVDYNFNQITNANNLVVSVEAALTVRAIGASKTNGFGFQLNQNPSNIKSVTGSFLTNNIISLNANGTEANQDKAVIIAFDNAFRILKHPGGNGVNTTKGLTYQAPKTVNIDVDLINPVAYNTFGTPPYNPFMIIDLDRSMEVHLPGSAPTSLADVSKFGTGDDDSNPATGKYYMSDNALPWAINLPVKFDYPAEKEDITKAFLKFNDWVASRGFNYMDWYQNKNGYRQASKLY